MVAPPFTTEQKNEYIIRTYGDFGAGVGARYRKYMPPNITHQYDTGDDNLFWTHTYFIDAAERKMIELMKLGASEAELLETFKQLLASNDLDSPYETFPKDYYFNAIMLESASLIDRVRAESTMLTDFLHSMQEENANLNIRKHSLSTLEELSAFAQEYPHASGVGVFMGEYAVSTSTLGPAIIATDSLFECVAVVLMGSDPRQSANKTVVLAHIDITTDIASDIERLLSEIPAEYDINAYLLGSDVNDNPYLNNEVAAAIIRSNRINSLAVNLDAPYSVAVHVPSATILTAPIGERARDNTIYDLTGVFPANIYFDNEREAENNLSSYREYSYKKLFDLTPKDLTHIQYTSRLARVIHPTEPAELMANPNRTIASLAVDGVLDKKDLGALAGDIGANLKTEGVCVFTQEDEIMAEFNYSETMIVGNVPNHAQDITGGKASCDR